MLTWTFPKKLYTKAISERPSSQLIALCDLNEERMKVHNGLLKEYGRPEAKTYHPVRSQGRPAGEVAADILSLQDDFEKMLKDEKLDVLVVTTVDATHDFYIIPALHAGVRVLTEKPMTT